MRHAGSPGKEKDVLTLPGEVDGVECKLILDSGANISVVPLEQVRAERVGMAIVQFGQTRRELPTAEVEIRVGGTTREETVALIAGEEINNEWLLALRLTRNENLQLVAREARIEVMCRRVETREMERMRKLRERQDKNRRLHLERAQPKHLAEVNLGEVEWIQEENQEEEFEEIALSEWKVGDDKERLVKETLEDKSLKEWRELSDKEMRGYRWENDLLLKRWVESGTEKTKEVIVLPKSRQDEVIRMAHNTCSLIVRACYNQIKTATSTRYQL